MRKMGNTNMIPDKHNYSVVSQHLNILVHLLSNNNHLGVIGLLCNLIKENAKISAHHIDDKNKMKLWRLNFISCHTRDMWLTGEPRNWDKI